MLKQKYIVAIALMGLGFPGLSLFPHASSALENSRVTAASKPNLEPNKRHASWQIADAVDTAKIYYNRARNKEKNGDYVGAIADYDEVIRLVPEYDKPYINRGNLRDNQGDTAGALKDYGQAININPQNYLGYYNRAVTLEKLNKRTEAISDYSQTINLKPTFISAHKNRGLNYLAIKDLQRAVNDFKNASTLYQKSGNQEGYQQMQQILRALGQ